LDKSNATPALKKNKNGDIYACLQHIHRFYPVAEGGEGLADVRQLVKQLGLFPCGIHPGLQLFDEVLRLRTKNSLRENRRVRGLLEEVKR